MITAFGYLHDGESGFQLPKGVVRIFTIEEGVLRIEVDNVHTDTTESKMCVVTDDHMTITSRSIDCDTSDGGHINIFIMEDNSLTVGFGSRAMFRGTIA